MRKRMSVNVVDIPILSLFHVFELVAVFALFVLGGIRSQTWAALAWIVIALFTCTLVGDSESTVSIVFGQIWRPAEKANFLYIAGTLFSAVALCIGFIQVHQKPRRMRS